jgi:single-strand DNA-binding protein
MSTITFEGNITHDPELRMTQTGISVTNFSLARTPRRYDSTAGEWVDGDTVFMRVNVWRQLAENVVQSLRKGDAVIVTGDLVQRTFEVDGVERTMHEITATNVAASLMWSTAELTKAVKKAAEKQPARARR